MKTLLPIVISFGLLIPFSPVGEYLWHTSQRQGHDLLLTSKQQAEIWSEALTQKRSDLSLWWQQSTTTLQADVAHSQQQLTQQSQTLAQRWQQQSMQWRDELEQQWQSVSSTLSQWPQELWQQARHSGESQWANLLQQQEQLQHSVSHSLTRLESQVTPQTE
ncbi:MAG: hypothetical protein ACRCRW_07360 [Aeromonadaceae bacterium]